MENELELEVGKTYKTRGGWKAIVIWKKEIFETMLVNGNGPSLREGQKPDKIDFLVIHRPATKMFKDSWGCDVRKCAEDERIFETGPMVHWPNGVILHEWGIPVVDTRPGSNGEHPGDIVSLW